MNLNSAACYCIVQSENVLCCIINLSSYAAKVAQSLKMGGEKVLWVKNLGGLDL